jgi:hypothetical protein
MKCWMNELTVNEKLEKMWDDEFVACFSSVLVFACRLRLLFLYTHTHTHTHIHTHIDTYKITFQYALCLPIREIYQSVIEFCFLPFPHTCFLLTPTSTPVSWPSCSRIYTIFYVLYIYILSSYKTVPQQAGFPAGADKFGQPAAQYLPLNLLQCIFIIHC